jgi:hypothetical protein
MKNEKPALAVTVDPNTPATLTDAQMTQVAGGLPLAGLGGVDPYMCCLTCASYGRQLFTAIAKTIVN